MASQTSSGLIGKGDKFTSIESDRVDALTSITNSLGVGIATPVSTAHIYESTSNTDSTTGLTIEQAGSGDSVIQWLCSGQRFVMGIDNDDSNQLKISTSTDVGTNTRLTMNVFGSISIGGTNPQSTFEVNGSVAIGSSYASAVGAPSNGLLVEGRSGFGTSAPFIGVGSGSGTYGSGWFGTHLKSTSGDGTVLVIEDDNNPRLHLADRGASSGKRNMGLQYAGDQLDFIAFNDAFGTTRTPLSITHDGVVTIGSGCSLSFPNGSDTLDHYEDEIISTNWTGPFGSDIVVSNNVACVRVGYQISITITCGFSDSASVATQHITSVTAISANFRPNITISKIIAVTDNSSIVTGVATIDSSGVIHFYVSVNLSNFQNSGNAGVPYNISFVYSLPRPA